MLPTGDEADNMEQSTLNYVFSLFGKGITQMLQQNVNSKTVLDELRSQFRSLQTQVANLTASMDEVEDRIFVRLQNMQPTIYTREGIPIDDALDMINSKMQSVNEKLVSNSEGIARVDAELEAKVDRDEYQSTASEAQKMNESFSDISNTIQSLQRELQKQRQESDDASERMIQTIKFQIESHHLHSQLSNNEQDMSNYVTHEELKKELSKLKLAGGVQSSGDDINSSAIVEFALQNGITDEDKVNDAYEILLKKKTDLDKNYNKQSEDINLEMSRLMKIAKNAAKGKGDNYDGEEEEEDEEDLEEDIEDDADVQDSPVEKAYVNVGLDTNDNYDEEEAQLRIENPGVKRRNIGLTANISEEKNGDKENGDGDDANGEEDTIVVEDQEADLPNRKMKKKRKSKKGMNNLINKMKKDQERAQQQMNQAPVVARIDEGKVTQHVLEAVMPRVENLLIDTLSGGVGGGIGGGVKLDRNEAKQLITQLSLLDGIKNEVKGLRVKVAMKVDRARVETELKTRVTRDELMQYLLAFFPDNDTIKQMAPQVAKSKLPPLNQGKKSASSVSMTEQQQHMLHGKNKMVNNSRVVLKPGRNSNMISLNQKFLRGADGHYYLRDMSSEAAAMQSTTQGSMFGNENPEDIDINAAFDFQSFKQVEQEGPTLKPNVVKNYREQTPEIV